MLSVRTVPVVTLGNMPEMAGFGAEFEETASEPKNVFNITKIGYGNVSMNLFKGISGEASWQFEAWRNTADCNDGLLDSLLSLCRDKKWNIYIRDCSFFGFPVYHIFIPRCSMIMNFGRLSLVRSKMRHQAMSALKNFPDAGKEQQLYALKTAELFSGWILHDKLDNMCGVSFKAELFGVLIDSRLLRALYEIKTGDYNAAAEDIKPYCALGEEFWCLYQLLMSASGKAELSESLSLTLRDPDALSGARLILDNPYSPLPRCAYPDCSECGRKDFCDTFYIESLLRSSGAI